VTFSVQAHQAVLEVFDDGPGFPEGFDPMVAGNTGLELGESLVRTDLSGQACYSSRSPQGGAAVQVMFALPEAGIETAC
jgi:two-component sensor histidine kinase